MKRLSFFILTIVSLACFVGCPDYSHLRPVPDYENMTDSSTRDGVEEANVADEQGNPTTADDIEQRNILIANKDSVWICQFPPATFMDAPHCAAKSTDCVNYNSYSSPHLRLIAPPEIKCMRESFNDIKL